jgi:hypothetical protein
MGLEIIALETGHDRGKSAPGLLNWKLNDVLLSSSSGAAVVLPAALHNNLPLLEFLAEWSARFTKANKLLFVVPKDRKNAERLAAAHPSLALNHAASVAELRKARPSLFDTPHAGAPSGPMAVGATVAASGEYVCSTCGKTRMWLKGDTAAACDNLECSDAQSGWQMTFMLF